MNSPAATPLSIAQMEQDQRPVLALSGELDSTTAPHLATVALSIVEEGARDVIIDASALTSCDSFGLSVFIQVATRLRARAGRLALVAPPDAVVSALRGEGLLDTLVVARTVPAALYAIHRDHP
jgi:anti-anti-sigma factor